MKDDFGVAARLKDRSLADEIVAQAVGVHEVPVVADADLTVRAVDEKRLRVGQAAFAGGRIADVSDRGAPRQFGQRRAVEDVRNVSHLLVHADPLAVRRRDAGALLAAMLQRIEAQIGHVRRFGVTEDAEHAAFVFELVQHVRPLSL